jgi:catechol 2,3-dioxygenase-like lactoylglutathione lyase family enzyme
MPDPQYVETRPILEHANLVVTAIEPTVAFLTAAFPGWHIRGRGNEPYAGKAREWVHVGDDDFYLALTAYDIDADKKGRQRDLQSLMPGLAHIGFVVPSVDELVERLERVGYAPSVWGPEHVHRRRVYFIDAEGLEFEFVEYLSDKPEERNSYV